MIISGFIDDGFSIHLGMISQKLTIIYGARSLDEVVMKFTGFQITKLCCDLWARICGHSTIRSQSNQSKVPNRVNLWCISSVPSTQQKIETDYKGSSSNSGIITRGKSHCQCCFQIFPPHKSDLMKRRCFITSHQTYHSDGWLKRHIKFHLIGGWATPLKNMSSSIGMMKFPTEWKIKVMFQSPPTSHIPLKSPRNSDWNPRNFRKRRGNRLWASCTSSAARTSGRSLKSPPKVVPVVLFSDDKSRRPEW